MKYKKVTAFLIVSIIISICAGCSKSCKECDGLAEIMAEIAECEAVINAPENNGDNEGSLESFEAEKKLDSLLGQYFTLSKHDCKMPIEKVSNKEYAWFATGTKGSYTGEWKSFGPCGNGTYLYEFANEWNSHTMKYSGNWEFGVPNGYGELFNKYSETYYIEYKGNFVDGEFDGEGVITKSYELNRYFGTNLSMIISGTFSNGKLTSSAEYVVYDAEGNLFDKGWVDTDQYITQSNRKEQYEARIKQQSDDTINDIASEFSKFIFDGLFS